MDRVDYQSLIVQDLINDHSEGKLNLTPWYQRRSVWSRTQKSYLINTLLERKPMPALYIRHSIDLEKGRSVKEVDDGQQRSRAIIDYCRNEFATRLPGSKKRNSKYSGEFKQFCLGVATRYLGFWREANIFTSNDIARMNEVQFVADLVLNLIEGIVDFRPANIDSLYEKYDDFFDLEENINSRILNVMDKFFDIPQRTFKDTIFHRQPIFFSLFLAVGQRPDITTHRLEDDMNYIDALYSDSDIRGSEVEGFRDAVSASTQRLASRKIRHSFILNNLH